MVFVVYSTTIFLAKKLAVPSTILGQHTLSQTLGANDDASTNNLQTASYVKNVEEDNWTKSYNYYDSKGRLVSTNTVNHLGGFTKTESELDFMGAPKNTVTKHARRADEAGITVKERFVYDDQKRLVQHYHQVDSKPEELLTENSYNELSQLTNKKVGNNLQSIDYAYNIRGWLTDINKNQMSLPDLGGKLFAYKIKYTQKDGIENPDPTQFAGKNVKARYNGNIAEVDWKAVETLGVNPSSSSSPKRYGYAYDNLNRLTAGYYQNPNNPYSKENTESLSYDLNGNISNLYRTSVLEGTSNTATIIDNLGYVYGTNGNQVTNINDISQNPTGYEGGGGIIIYDLNGNMTTMPDKGISIIKYNYLSLPNSLHINKNSIEDITINTKYKADGTKLVKENITILTGFMGSTTTKNTIDYLDGFQYLKTENITGGFSEVLAASSLSLRAMQPLAFSIDRPIGPIDPPTIDPPIGGGGIIVDLKTLDLQFFPTSEGFYDYQKDQYIYQYKDHLGNNRISFTRNSTGALEITDNNDYYPFGMNHLKTGNAFFGQVSYKSYKYNGKELQETGMYDYGARMYMPDLGRWGVVDPLAEKMTRHSPYNYAFNNPIRFIDPDGRKPEQIEPGSQGEWNRQKQAVQGQYLSAVAVNVVTNGAFSDKVKSLNATLNTLNTLEQSSQIYSLSTIGTTDIGGITYDPNTSNIVIAFGTTSNFVHEAIHGGQYESGDIAFDGNTGNVLAQDINDEVSAYKSQYFYDSSSVSGLPSTSGTTVNSVNDITSDWVQGLDGGTLYNPGGRANIGVTPLNINSTKTDFINAFPLNAGALNSLPDNYILKNDYSNIKNK